MWAKEIARESGTRRRRTRRAVEDHIGQWNRRTSGVGLTDGDTATNVVAVKWWTKGGSGGPQQQERGRGARAHHAGSLGPLADLGRDRREPVEQSGARAPHPREPAGRRAGVVDGRARR